MQLVNFNINVGTGLKGVKWNHSSGQNGDRIVGVGYNDTFVFHLKLISPNELALFYGQANHEVNEITNLLIYGKLK
jgi:hypothetical protein